MYNYTIRTTYGTERNVEAHNADDALLIANVHERDVIEIERGEYIPQPDE